jgi:hypothetical protein
MPERTGEPIILKGIPLWKLTTYDSKLMLAIKKIECFNCGALLEYANIEVGIVQRKCKCGKMNYVTGSK